MRGPFLCTTYSTLIWCPLVPFLLVVFWMNSGCGKTTYSTDSSLSLAFSADTILFDTVFTTIGSITLPLKVYNRNADALRIQSVELESGAESAFRMNVDGEAGHLLEDWPLLAGDSLWIFLEVTVDPTNQANPFVIEDLIRFRTNGNDQFVTLAAWGQNAHFHGGLDNITPLPSCNETWSPDRPHVIYGIVEVEEGCQLTVLEGTQVHVHQSGGLLVYQSTLRVLGSLNQKVVFQGDRMETGYEDLPGQWGITLDFEFETEYGIEEVTIARGGIWLYGAVDCTMDHAILKNGTIGLQVDTTGSATSPALQITNTIIHNMAGIGMLAQGGTIDGYNNLFYDCGQATAAFTLGGTYRLDHCTFVNYWSEGVRQAPSVLLNDWYEDINGQIQQRTLEGSLFNNCIIWGNNALLTDFDELILDVLSPPESPIFSNCAVDVNDPEFPFEQLVSCTTDDHPDFESISNRDFHIASNNTLWDGGWSQFSIGLDLDGMPRIIGAPDKGCFERQ